MTARRSLPVGSPSTLWRSPWPLLALAVAYCTLSTRDIELGPVPVKFLVTALALGVWIWHRRAQPVPWRTPLLVFGLGFPAFGLAVALTRDLLGDDSQRLGLRAAAEEASRFGYVLLAIPLIDWSHRQNARAATSIWLWPVAALAALTWGLYALHLAGVGFDGSGRVGPLQGDISPDPITGTFRAFMVTHVLFIPALVLLFARLHAGPRRVSDAVLAGVIVGGVFLSHSRGIWLGVIVACAVAMLLRLVLERPEMRIGLPFAAIAVVLLLAALAVPTALRPVTEAFTGGDAEVSASLRLEQAPELLHGFAAHPVIGAGMGGVLASGYQRSAEAPWSFELTYLQLLFQGGLVGFGLLAWLPFVVLRDAVRRVLGGVPSEVAVSLVAGIGAVVGLLVAYAGNPYLTTSAGALALAIGVTGCAAAAARRQADAGAPPRWPHRRVATERGHADGSRGRGARPSAPQGGA